MKNILLKMEISVIIDHHLLSVRPSVFGFIFQMMTQQQQGAAPYAPPVGEPPLNPAPLLLHSLLPRCLVEQPPSAASEE